MRWVRDRDILNPPHQHILFWSRSSDRFLRCKLGDWLAHLPVGDRCTVLAEIKSSLRLMLQLEDIIKSGRATIMSEGKCNFIDLTLLIELATVSNPPLKAKVTFLTRVNPVRPVGLVMLLCWCFTASQ